VQLKPGALLFNYTDGLIEFENEDGLQFEVSQLTEFINVNYDAPAQPFNALLLDTIDKFKGDRPFMDDISILTCRFL
jgi:sigma-B regulation protein RsbU (phosphoserine phosphatase)